MKDGLYVEGEWEESGDGSSKENTSFTIDKQFILSTKIKTKQGIKSAKYMIGNDGKWEQTR